jgi:hypothetical protein
MNSWNRNIVISIWSTVICHWFLNHLQKLAEKTRFFLIPMVHATSPLGCGCRPLFINTLQKHAKKTNFFADPNLVSRHGGILGCGCHPLFE